MRKFWFAYLAKALLVFPGGFGTLDELFEILTLRQTGKMRKNLAIVLFGAEYWNEVINFDALVRHGTINREDLRLFHRTDSADEAFEIVTRHLTEHAMAERGAFL
jgi:predicted Rossmann-fold nucleotide-binding protein